MSDNAREIWKSELGNEDYNNLPVKFYDKKDFNAPFASGSAKYNIMIAVPAVWALLAELQPASAMIL
jgi:4-hydroxy-3-polyprenylbenzoate decarboxylase